MKLRTEKNENFGYTSEFIKTFEIAGEKPADFSKNFS